MPIDKRKETLLQKVILAKKWMSKKDLSECLAFQKQHPDRELSNILVEKGFITAGQVRTLMGFVDKKMDDEYSGEQRRRPEGMDDDAQAKMAGYLATMEALSKSKPQQGRVDKSLISDAEVSRPKSLIYLFGVLAVLAAIVIFFVYSGPQKPPAGVPRKPQVQQPSFSSSADGFKLLGEWLAKEDTPDRNRTIAFITNKLALVLQEEAPTVLRGINGYFVNNAENVGLVEQAMAVDLDEATVAGLRFFRKLRVALSEGRRENSGSELGNPYNMSDIIVKYSVNKYPLVRQEIVFIAAERMPKILSEMYRNEKENDIKEKIVERMLKRISADKNSFCEIIYVHYNAKLLRLLQSVSDAFGKIDRNALEEADRIEDRVDSLAKRSQLLSFISALLNDTKVFCSISIGGIPREVFDWYNERRFAGSVYLPEEGFPLSPEAGDVISTCIRSDVPEIAIPMLKIAGYFRFSAPYKIKGSVWTIRDLILEPIESSESDPAIKKAAIDVIGDLVAVVLKSARRRVDEQAYLRARQKVYVATESDLVHPVSKTAISMMEFWLIKVLSSDDEQAYMYAKRNARFFNKVLIVLKRLIGSQVGDVRRSQEYNRVRVEAINRVKYFPLPFYDDALVKLIKNTGESSTQAKGLAINILGVSRNSFYLDDPFGVIIDEVQGSRRESPAILDSIVRQTVFLIQHAQPDQAKRAHKRLLSLLRFLSGKETIAVKVQIINGFVMLRDWYNRSVLRRLTNIRKARPEWKHVQPPPLDLTVMLTDKSPTYLPRDLEDELVRYVAGILERRDPAEKELVSFSIQLLDLFAPERLSNRALASYALKAGDGAASAVAERILARRISDSGGFSLLAEEYRAARKDRDWSRANKVLGLFDRTNYENADAAKALVSVFRSEINFADRLDLRRRTVYMLSKRANFEFVRGVLKELLGGTFARKYNISEEEKNEARIAVECGEANSIFRNIENSDSADDLRRYITKLRKMANEVESADGKRLVDKLLKQADLKENVVFLPRYPKSDRRGDWVLFTSAATIYLKTLKGLLERPGANGSEIDVTYGYRQLSDIGLEEGSWDGKPISLEELRKPQKFAASLVYSGEDNVLVPGKGKIACKTFVYPLPRSYWMKRWYSVSGSLRVPFGILREERGTRRKLDSTSRDMFYDAKLVVVGSFRASGEGVGAIAVESTVKGAGPASLDVNVSRIKLPSFATGGETCLWLVYREGGEYVIKDPLHIIPRDRYKISVYNRGGNKRVFSVIRINSTEYVIEGRDVIRFNFGQVSYKVADFGDESKVCGYVRKTKPAASDDREGDWAIVKEGGDTWYFIEVRYCSPDEDNDQIPDKEKRPKDLYYVRQYFKRLEMVLEGAKIYEPLNMKGVEPSTRHLAPANALTRNDVPVSVPGRKTDAICTEYRYTNLRTGQPVLKYVSRDVPFGDVLMDKDGPVINYEVLSYGYKDYDPKVHLPAAFELYKKRVEAMGFEQPEKEDK